MPTSREDFQRIRPVLSGALVRLRAMEEGDLQRVNELFWDPEVSAGVGAVWPEPVAGTRAFWQRADEDPGEMLLAIEGPDGHLVGGCSLFGIDAARRSATLGVWVAKAMWGRGYGTDAVRTLCRFAFREMNLQRVDLTVFETNARAIRAYETVGFKEEGRRRRAHFEGGRFVDVVQMGLLAEDLIEP